MNPVELLKSLINIPSITGEEAQISLFLSELLKKTGLNVLSQSVEGSRINLFADTGCPSKVVLCTHMDTVPPFIPASEDKYTIYGRGACDAKGSLAAMVAAAKELIDEGEKRFGLLLVVGEEGDSIGAKTANGLNIQSEFIIVGEPTKNKLASSHKGIIWMRLISKGKTAHSAYPDLGDSAVDKLLNALDFLRQVDLSENSDSGKSTINIGRIEGGLSANMVPGSACAEIVVRCVEPVYNVIQKISAGLKNLVEVKIISRSDPQKMFTVPNIEQTVVPFGTDIPHLKTFGKPLLLGPGDGIDAHAETEKVQKSQLREAVLLYKQLVQQLLG